MVINLFVNDRKECQDREIEKLKIIVINSLQKEIKNYLL